MHMFSTLKILYSHYNPDKISSTKFINFDLKHRKRSWSPWCKKWVCNDNYNTLTNAGCTGQAPTTEELNAMFEAADQDKDGKISFEGIYDHELLMLNAIF